MTKRTIKRLLGQLSYVSDLRRHVHRQGLFPAGHPLSPIPSEDDLRRGLAARDRVGESLPDIDLDPDGQLQLLESYLPYYADLPFTEQETSNCRYYYAQDWFCHADAIFLYNFLRHYQPRRIVEVGSGYSSAVILDTAGRWLGPATEITFIDPAPARLLDLLRPGDQEKVRIVATQVQDADREIFAQLGTGDLLFIDSSHVVKCGSDVHYLLFEVLPRLPQGVFVHFHDIFYPFEYPIEWLEAGRYWNECYFLRAFLAGNRDWRIIFFNDYVAHRFRPQLEEKMPLCLKNTGGSIYLRKLSAAPGV